MLYKRKYMYRNEKSVSMCEWGGGHRKPSNNNKNKNKNSNNSNGRAYYVIDKLLLDSENKKALNWTRNILESSCSVCRLTRIILKWISNTDVVDT
jgi:hypothetical protein